MGPQYYPKNRIKPNLFTAGGEFAINGQDYRGPYYITFDGKTLTGKNPYYPGANIPLIKVSYAGFDGREPDSSLALNIINEGPEVALNTLVPYYPNPTQADYTRGHFIRYFAKKVNGDLGIVEISKAKFDYMQNRKTNPEDYLYQVENVFWKLTGPLHDDRTNKQYPVAGIIDTNQRLVETKDKTFPGLKAYIGGNYTKFSIPS
jgi:hypothetical protein